MESNRLGAAGSAAQSCLKPGTEEAPKASVRSERPATAEKQAGPAGAQAGQSAQSEFSVFSGNSATALSAVKYRVQTQEQAPMPLASQHRHGRTMDEAGLFELTSVFSENVARPNEPSHSAAETQTLLLQPGQQISFAALLNGIADDKTRAKAGDLGAALDNAPASSDFRNLLIALNRSDSVHMNSERRKAVFGLVQKITADPALKSRIDGLCQAAAPEPAGGFHTVAVLDMLVRAASLHEAKRDMSDKRFHDLSQRLLSEVCLEKVKSVATKNIQGLATRADRHEGLVAHHAVAALKDRFALPTQLDVADFRNNERAALDRTELGYVEKEVKAFLNNKEELMSFLQSNEHAVSAMNELMHKDWAKAVAREKRAGSEHPESIVRRDAVRKAVEHFQKTVKKSPVDTAVSNFRKVFSAPRETVQSRFFLEQPETD